MSKYRSTILSEKEYQQLRATDVDILELWIKIGCTKRLANFTLEEFKNTTAPKDSNGEAVNDRMASQRQEFTAATALSVLDTYKANPRDIHPIHLALTAFHAAFDSLTELFIPKIAPLTLESQVAAQAQFKNVESQFELWSEEIRFIKESLLPRKSIESDCEQDGYIYLAHLSTGLWKLGVSEVDPKARVAKLDGSLPYELTFHHKFWSNRAVRVERLLQMRFAHKAARPVTDFRKRKEWFAFSDEDIEHIKALGEIVFL